MKLFRSVCAFFLFLTFMAGSPVVKSRAADELLTPEQMRENLEYIHKTIIERHPSPYKTTPKAEFEKLYQDLMSQFSKPLPPREFYFAAARLVAAVGKDAHTGLYYDDVYYNQEYLPLEMVWVEDGLGILKAPENPELVHSKVLAFNGETPDAWLEKLASVFNHENTEKLRKDGKGDLLNEWIQQHFSGKDDIKGVAVKAEKDGKVVESFVSFVATKRFQELLPYEAPYEYFYSYRMMDDLSAGLFTLNMCLPEQEYFEAMDKFFEEVKEKNYRNVIVDLRQNPGGVSSLLFGFMKHLPGDSFKLGTGLGPGGKWDKYSQKPSIWRKSSEEKAIEPFKGRVYVLIAQKTFSAGNEFAFTLKDNGLATLVGQKTSNAPCSFGAINPTDLPHGKFTLSVSSKYFKRPSLNCDDDGLVPDVAVPLTLEDIFTGRDPIMEWLKNNLK